MPSESGPTGRGDSSSAGVGGGGIRGALPTGRSIAAAVVILTLMVWAWVPSLRPTTAASAVTETSGQTPTVGMLSENKRTILRPLCLLTSRLRDSGLLTERQGVVFDRKRLGHGPPAGTGGAVRVHFACMKSDGTVVTNSRDPDRAEVWRRDALPHLGLLVVLAEMRAGDHWWVMTPPDRALTVDRATGTLRAIPEDAVEPTVTVDEMRFYDIEVLEVMDPVRKGTSDPVASEAPSHSIKGDIP